MVKRSHPRNLTYLILLALLGLIAAPRTVDAQSAGGAEAMKQYMSAQEALNAAQREGNRDAMQAQQTASLNALRMAEDAFKEQFARSGASDDALGYIEVLRLKGDHDLAAEFASNVLETGTESAALWRIYGVCLLKLGSQRHQEGIDALNASLAIDDTSQEAAETWNELGFYFLSMRMPGSAEKAFASASTIDAKNIRTSLGLLTVDVYNGDMVQAGKRLSEIGREAQPYDALLREKMRLALADFDTHRRSFSDTAENHYAYARLLYAAARVPEAVMAAHRAAKLADTDTSMWGFLIAIQLQLGDYPGAQASCEASLKANPNQPDIQQTLERVRQEMTKTASPPLSGQGPLR